MKPDLNEKELNFNKIIENSREGILIVNIEGVVRFANPAAHILLNQKNIDLIGKSFGRPLDDEKAVEMGIVRLNSSVGTGEMRLSETVWEGKKAYLILLLDVTELKKTELELENKNRQLKRLADTLFHAEDEERKRLADLLHDDLQQILVACMMKLSLPQDSGEEREGINKLLIQAIDTSRLLATELRPPALFEKGLVAGVHWFIPRIVKQFGVSIDVQTDGYEEIADQNVNSMLYQCLRELIFNVIKHARVSQAVLIFSTVQGESRIQVNDLGLGFVVTDVDGRKDAEQPSSLGYFSIRERLRAIGGSYSVVSDPGRGTSVLLTIPRQKTTSLFLSNGPVAKYPAGSTAKIRILVVDDHKLVRQGIISVLSAEKDIVVVGEAEDGMEAVSRTGELRPDVIVMDLNMPVLNGSGAARLLREKGSAAKIIIISVNADERSKRTVLEAGADAFLSKSSNLEELLRVIRTHAP